MTAFEYNTIMCENKCLRSQVKDLKKKLKDLENLDGDTIEMAGYKRGVKETIDKVCAYLDSNDCKITAIAIRKAMEEEL